MTETRERNNRPTPDEPQKNEAEIHLGQKNNTKEAISNINTTETNSESTTIPIEEIGNINFGYNPNQQKNEKLVSQFNDNAKGNNSLEGRLAQNEQIQLLLSELLSEYKNYIGTDKEILKILINQENSIINNEDQSKMIDSMYQYLLVNDNEIGFENFILSNGITSIKEHLLTHVDKNGKFSFISKNEIKAKLKINWFINLYRGYRQDHVENSEALTHLEEELTLFTNAASQLKLAIDDGIKQYLGGKYGKDKLAQYLNGLLLEAKQDENLQKLIGSKDKNSILSVIRYGIKEYARLLNVSDKNPQLKNTGDKVFDMQIRSYLYLYGLIAYGGDNKSNNGENNKEPEHFFDPKKGLDDNELGEILRTILISDGIMKDDGKNKYLKSERKLKEEQTRQDITRRKEARARINLMQNKEQKFEGLGLKDSKNSSIDIQSATGVEIVQDRQLGSQITGFDRKEKSSEIEDLRLQRVALIHTGKMFIKDNQDTFLSNYLNVTDIQMFFTVGKNSVTLDYEKRKDFRNKWVTDHPDSNPNELDRVLGVLQTFPSKYKDNLEKAGFFINEKKDQAHEIIKDYALGAVMDNIKDMFQNIINTNNTGSFMSGFEFNEEGYARIENNCLLLSGKFNGETMNIKYDLNTGKLYMNSFINESNERIVIGGTKTDYEIGELKPFESILDDFYSNPTESMSRDIFSGTRGPSIARNDGRNVSGNQQGSQDQPQAPRPQMKHRMAEMRDKIKNEHKLKFQKMCGTKLDEISGKIKYKVESRSNREPVALNLLRTLGIMPEDAHTINLTSGSDLYKIIQLITSPNNKAEDINKFSECMKTFMYDIGGNRGENTDKLDEKRRTSAIISDESNDQEYISYVRKNTQNFDIECVSAKGKEQFDGTSNFGILKIIEEKFTDGDFPNWKLDSNKIKNFEENLMSNMEEVRSKTNDIARLEKEIDSSENWE